jgi:pimeloyl-ACP methyl ester carboxylesterase
MPVAQLNGIDINYEVHGEGTPIVLAHGYTASLEMWREQIPALSATHRLVIYDTRGHGATTVPADMERYSLARDYVADQLALMDHLRIGDAIVGGLSMGGMIAQEFALQHPGRVSALLLFDTGPGMSALNRDPAVAERFGQMRAMLQSLARTKGMSAIVDAMRNSPMAISMGAAGAPLPDAVRRHLANMRKMSVDGYLGGAKAMQDWPGTLDRLHTINVPTLVLVGERDRLLPASRAIHARIAGSRFVLLNGAGHGTNMWRADAFIAATVSFLEDVAAGRPVAGEIVVS